MNTEANEFVGCSLVRVGCFVGWQFFVVVVVVSIYSWVASLLFVVFLVFVYLMVTPPTNNTKSRFGMLTRNAPHTTHNAKKTVIQNECRYLATRILNLYRNSQLC